MAYLNANIPVEYAQIRREYLYDLKKHHGEVEDCIIFGVAVLQVVLYYFMLSWKTAQSFIASQLARLFKEDLKLPPYHKEDLMNFSSGILLVIILLFIVGTF